MISKSTLSSVADDTPVVVDLCNPSPCGPNAICQDGTCTCIPEYHGDPYSGCRPECVTNDDCSRDRACIRNKCVDPCPGTCGSNAICSVINHIPMCSCPQGMNGNAFFQCVPILGIYALIEPILILKRTCWCNITKKYWKLKRACVKNEITWVSSFMSWDYSIKFN